MRSERSRKPLPIAVQQHAEQGHDGGLARLRLRRESVSEALRQQDVPTVRRRQGGLRVRHARRAVRGTGGEPQLSAAGSCMRGLVRLCVGADVDYKSTKNIYYIINYMYR